MILLSLQLNALRIVPLRMQAERVRLIEVVPNTSKMTVEATAILMIAKLTISTMNSRAAVAMTMMITLPIEHTMVDQRRTTHLKMILVTTTTEIGT